MPQNPRIHTRLWLVAAFAQVLLAQPGFAESWELLYRKGPLAVYVDEAAAVPTFKAESTIPAHLFDVLAVLSDTARRPEWVRDLKESRIVQGDVQTKVVIYERFHLPWPLSDRDSVVESVIEQNLKKLEVLVRYREVSHPKELVRSGITRMPVVRGSMYFRYVNKQASFARIIMTLDVGGLLPEFAVSRFVRQAPAITLDGLLRQVRKTTGKYQGFVRQIAEKARAHSELPFDWDDPASPAVTP